MSTNVERLTAYQAATKQQKHRETVIALHCSGGNANQWKTLGKTLGAGRVLLTPEHYGTRPERKWNSVHPLTLADEAELSLRMIDHAPSPVHLVGHSYGGALALHIALARPDRIASVSLFEPCAFHLLPQLGSFARAELAEIGRVAELVLAYTSSGDTAAAMREFVNYWNGANAWEQMQPEHQQYLTNWAVNANNGFDALLSEDSDLSSYHKISAPVLLLQGSESPAPTHCITKILEQVLPQRSTLTLKNVGHMGPLTHSDVVARAINHHIESSRSGHDLTQNPSLVTTLATTTVEAAA